ncbi:hypothetical protein HCN44_002832 [Aphidius gifuensis]|uniref:Rhodanese domain-containing protein n=1 Tax=Aphidius gifuensis TaxID=684658 RepID=A0A834XSV4_APHGI|nr:rhodanese domain-containing protein CG4456-like [Aphidius gifuensis]KAF7991270.1 hypothetical protein HCN44_002832 [Aphidius gifuensis]
MNFIRSLRQLQPFRSLSQVFTQSNVIVTPKLNLSTTQGKLVNLSSINNMSSIKKNVDFDGLLEAQNDKNILIIDVREQSEIDETGKLPGSIHIPMANVSSQLQINNDDFQKKYQTSKPTKQTKIVLSCRSGMRSGKVQEELQKLGYENAYNYTGGWSEWESKQKS